MAGGKRQGNVHGAGRQALDLGHKGGIGLSDETGQVVVDGPQQARAGHRE